MTEVVERAREEFRLIINPSKSKDMRITKR